MHDVIDQHNNNTNNSYNNGRGFGQCFVIKIVQRDVSHGVGKADFCLINNTTKFGVYNFKRHNEN